MTRLIIFLLLISPGWAQEVYRTAHGSYAEVGSARPTRIVVVLHGSLGESETAIKVARTMTRLWLPAARKYRLLVVAPAFDQQNFGGRAGPFGGYRGMFGRHVGADEFVHEVVSHARHRNPGLKKKFYLYGHSAGGQMVSRYLVAHPSRVQRAVISAAGTYAFPDPNLPWTDGMAPIERDYVWQPGDPVEHFAYRPDPRAWLEAARLPVTVVVGDQDKTSVPVIEGLPKANLVGRAKHWVKAMHGHARRNGQSSGVRLKLVKGAGHDSRKLLPACLEALFEQDRKS